MAILISIENVSFYAILSCFFAIISIVSKCYNGHVFSLMSNFIIIPKQHIMYYYSLSAYCNITSVTDRLCWVTQ